jgi:hypothetical protein
MTRWRDPGERPERRRTARIARRNLLWHLFLPYYLGYLMLQALWNSKLWFRSLSAILVLPSAAYLAGSIVQRHKIAILTLRGEGHLSRD